MLEEIARLLIYGAVGFTISHILQRVRRTREQAGVEELTSIDSVPVLFDGRPGGA